MSTLSTIPVNAAVTSIIKSIVAATLISSCLLVISACDSQNITSESTVGDNNIAQTDPEIIERNSMQAETSNAASNEPTVGPAGYGGLSFGQAITPDSINKVGLIKGEHGYDECYYLQDPTKQGVKRNDAVFEPIYYQVIDGKLALIGINASDIKFYTGIHSGDSVDKVITTHPNNLSYSMDKYDQTGNYYHIIYNVPTQDIPTQTDTLPLQIKYTMTGGQKIAHANKMTMPLNEWPADQRAQLQGQVETIELGIPDAIMLVEGCS